LKGFKRIALASGETKLVTFSLPVSVLGFYGRSHNKIVEPGEIKVMIGTSSDDIHLQGCFQISGDVTDVSKENAFFSDVQVHH
jgi:beta-glucosidase